MKNHFALRTFAIVCTALMALALGPLPPTPAYAANFTAGNAVTLIAAINAANANGQADIITLTANITLTTVDNLTDGSNGLPVINSPITIEGSGFILSRSTGGATPDFRIFDVSSNGNLTINNLTIANGKCTSCGGGGGVNQGTLNVTNSTFSGNTTTGAAGAIYNLGTLNVANSTFSSNSAPNAFAGGIFNFGTATLTVTNSTFSNNSAPVGGGIESFGGDQGTITVTNSTFSGNSASGGNGGGIFNGGGTLSVTNSTFSGNSAIGSGGGIFNNATVTLRDTIVANSPSGGNCFGTITNGGNNLQFGGTVASSCGAAIPTSDPKLGSLANNGGATQTMALLPGSAAIDTGNDAVCAAAVGSPSFGAGGADQRGVSRPKGAHCDIGAYEFDPPAAPKEVPEADTLLLLSGGIGGLATWVGWQRRKLRGKK